MRDCTELSDEALVALLRDDELAAFKEVYKRYWKKLYAAAYKRLKDTDLAEEIVQEFFTSFWIKRKKLQINTSLLNYLYTAISHQVIDQYRKEAVRLKYQQSFNNHLADYDNSTQETIFLHDLQNNIEHEVSNLPPKCRSVYELSRKEYKSNKEIALSLGISEKTVENHLTKALKHLKLSLGHYTLVIVLWLFC